MAILKLLPNDDQPFDRGNARIKLCTGVCVNGVGDLGVDADGTQVESVTTLVDLKGTPMEGRIAVVLAC